MDEALYHLHARFEETYWWFAAKNGIVTSLAARYAPRSGAAGARGRACEIGCGSGGLLARLGERFEAVGVEMSPIGREYCAKRGLRVMDGMLPGGLPRELEVGSFDVVVLSEVLEHVDDDAGSVRAAAGLLRKGGVLVCTVPAHPWMWSAHDEHNHHRRRYTAGAFARLFDGEGLERVVLSPYNAAMFPPMAAVRLARRVMRREPEAGELKALPRGVNWVLREVFAAEGRVLPRVRLPCGVSLISVHRRR